MELSKQSILSATRKQLATDLNCSVEDFDREGFVFCKAKENPGRRPFPRGETHFEMLTMGGAVIVSATAELLLYLREELDGKSRDDAFSMPFVFGCGAYFLPDNPRPLPLVGDVEFSFVERHEIAGYYELTGFENAMQYDTHHPRPDMLLITAKKGGEIVGIAGTSEDCDMLWQVGVDVLPAYRHLGIAAIMTNRLAIEIMRRGKISYYGTASSNVASQRVAHRAGFQLSWVCAYRGIFGGLKTAPTG